MKFLFVAIIGLLGLAGFGFWVWMLVDCLTNVRSDGNDKLLWVLVILFANWVGALVYFFVQRPKNGIT
jgi:hypothetical protein